MKIIIISFLRKTQILKFFAVKKIFSSLLSKRESPFGFWALGLGLKSGACPGGMNYKKWHVPGTAKFPINFVKFCIKFLKYSQKFSNIFSKSKNLGPYEQAKTVWWTFSFSQRYLIDCPCSQLLCGHTIFSLDTEVFIFLNYYYCLLAIKYFFALLFL